MFNKFNPLFRQISSLMVAVMLAFHGPLYALDSDSAQPINIQANQAEFNPETGIATYTGDVKLNQGSLKVKAHAVTIYQDNNGEISKVVATGKSKRVHMQQKPEPDSPEVHAFAMYAEYLSVEQEVLLKDNAELENGKDRFTGDRIRYNLQTRNIRAWGDKNSSSQSQSSAPGQVKIILYPKNNQSSAQ